MKRYLLLSGLFCFSFFYTNAQQDVLFWFAAPEISQTGGSNLDRPIFLRMTAFATAASVTISQPAGGGFPTTVVAIPANSTVSLDMTPWIDFLENKPPNTILNFGLKIQSTTPISAYYHVVSGSCLCNPEHFVLKGNNALGTDFWIPGQNILDNSLSYTPTPHNAFDIVATQNGTTVNITPSRDIVGHLAGITFSVVLNAGQTYSATAAGTVAAQHLQGSRVTSDKPIAITEKDDLLGFTSLGVFGADLIGDQIVPVNVLGKEYIPMYGNLTAPGDQLFITATAPATTITVNGVYVTTIGVGATYQMTALAPSCYIQTSSPVYIYQLSGIHSEVGSALLPQINCTGSNSVSIQQSATIDFKLNLLVKTVGTGGFLVNGAAGVITPGMFTVVPATGGVWSSAQVTLPVSSYPIGSVLKVDNPTNLFQMGYLSSGPVGSGASFGYFSNYGGINPNPVTTTPSVCVGDSIKLFSDTFNSVTNYFWTGPGGYTSTLRNPVIPGSGTVDSGVYQVLIVTPGCRDSALVAIAVHPYPAVNLGNDTLICGTASITLQDLDPVYASDTYLWSTTATTSTISVSTSGTYWLKVTNAGCTKSDTIDVAIVPLVNPVVAPISYCQNAASVPLTAIGTSLLWYSSATGGIGSPTAPTPVTTIPGTTTYYVTSSSGPCESPRVPLNVTVIPLPPPPVISGINPYCQGQPFVPFTVTGTGVLWYPGPTGGVGSPTAPFVNTAIPGHDTFYASQTVSGCEGPRYMYAVTVLDFITAGFSYNVHYGCKADTVLFANSSTGAVKYLWDYGDGASDTSASPVHIYTSQDSFKVKLLAINAQCLDSMLNTIQLIHPLKANFVISPVLLCQNSPVTFTNISIGTGLSYKWLFGDGATDVNTNPVYTYARAGIYNVKLIATDFVPCKDTAYGAVSVDSTTGIDMTITDSVMCKSTFITFAGNYTSIGDTGVTWTFGDGDSITNINPVQHAYDRSGTFTVTVKPHYRVCRDTSISKTINVVFPPQLYLGMDTTICPGGEYITIGDNANAANTSAKWKWNTGQTTPNIVVSAPGVYYASVNIDGCYATDTITVENDCYMNIPNVFSPNKDGMNDYFFPRQYLAKGLTSFKMDIYNRWGQLIFETTSLEGAGWDGKFNNVDQPVGVYVYVIDATFKDGQKEHHQSNVTLLR